MALGATSDRVSQALKLRAEGCTYADIATIMGLTRAAVCGLFFRHRNPTVPKRRIVKKLGEIKAAKRREQARIITLLSEAGIRASEPRSVTAWVLGDPPPSRSALAQRQTSDVRPS